MRLPQVGDRDRQVIQVVGQFKRLTSSHIHELVFHDVTRTSARRSVQRLVRAEYLYSIERFRLNGGAAGGSGQYVYALGRHGWWLENEAAGYVRPRPFSMHTFHTLAVADVYVELVKLHRAGRLELIGISTEPDCHRRVGRYELTPDLHLAVQRADRKLELWLEIDRGFEGRKVIQSKLARYKGAFDHDGAGALTVFPGVVFVVDDEPRRREILWFIESWGADVPDGMFRVMTKGELLARLVS